MNSANAQLTTNEPTLLSSLRALPRPVWILFFGTFLNKFGTFVVPFLTLYLTRQGYSLGAAGLAIGSYGVGNLIASLLGGHLADTIGRRKTIVLSMFSGSVSMLLLSQARGLPAIMICSALAGLTGELYRPASSALLTDLTPAGQRVTAFATYRLAFNAGWAFGPATAGFLAERGYLWLFIGDATTSALYGVLALVALPKGLRARERESTWMEIFRVARGDRRFHQLLAASFGVALIFFQMASTFGVHVTNLGFSSATYGAIISLNGALVVLCELPLTMITRRFPAYRTMAIGYLLVGTGFALNGLAHTIPALIACVVIFTLGEMIALPVAGAYVADLAPTNMRGRYMGLYTVTWASALVVGPGLGLRLYGHAPVAYWLASAALCVASAFILTRPLRPSGVPAMD
jgi:MFS family permease